MKNILVTLVLLAFAGCAAFQPASVETISKLPVVRVGENPPANSEYVVFFPAGYAFPVKLKVSGSLFPNEKEIESRVVLSKDLYLYKYWASHDRTTWKNSHELLGVEFDGGFDVTGLHANMKLEAK